MSTPDPTRGAAVEPAAGVPVFYICDQSLPRPCALLHGAVLAAAFLAGVCLLIARGGGFPGVLIGSHQPSRSHRISAPTAAAPVALSTEVRVKQEPSEVIPFYFRLLAIVSVLDANHDGIISAGEIAHAPQLLATLDANHNGRLDADECGGNFGDKPLTTGPTPDELTRLLMSFDRNHDGKLERSELPERLQGLFDRGDPNKTGVLLAAGIRQLAAAEQAARATAPLDPQFLQRARLAFMRIHPILAALDADRNGEISGAEMRNSPAMLRTLDSNNDGQLTVTEILPDPLASAAAQFVSVFDINSDRTISREEWTPVFGKRLRHALTRAGRSRNGLVTAQDLVNQIGLNPDTGREDVTAYEEMLAATRQGFAAIVARSRSPK
ncbi:MAG: EF-hand domain-containing protein [Candidatus Sulfopaludibacter sp.]|nr:EF-hand domain-containing protein [Candidatus Sulfopaludibacter sp.]